MSISKLDETIEAFEYYLKDTQRLVLHIHAGTVMSALGFLKKQKQKETPQLVNDIQKLGGQLSAFCPSCGRGLYDKNLSTKYCYNCGQAVKWE